MNGNELTQEKIKEASLKMARTESIIRNAFARALDYTRIIILGSSGVSKSTIANIIIGQILKIKENEFGNIFLDANDAPFHMGEEMISDTTIPNIYVDHSRKLLICDAPGFDDNRGVLQDIINAFAINLLFTDPCKIKILFVFSANEASIQSGRGIKVAQNIKRITQIIPNEDELKKSLGVVITRGDGRSPDKYIKQLISGNPDELLVNYCNFFIEKINERVFNFPEGSRERIGKNYIFADKEKLLNFLRKEPIVNPKHKVVLSTEGKYAVIRMSQEFGNIDDLLKELIANIKKAYVLGDGNIRELTELNNVLTKIQKSIQRIESPNDFAKNVERNIKRHREIDQSLNKIRGFDSMFSFISSVDGYTRSSQLTQFGAKARNAIYDENTKILHLLQMKKLQNDFEDNKKTVTKLKSTIKTKDQEIADLIKKQETTNQKNKEEIQNLKQQLDTKNSGEPTKSQKSEDSNFSNILTSLLGFGLQILGNKSFNQKSMSDSDSDSDDEFYRRRRSPQQMLINNSPYPPNRPIPYRMMTPEFSPPLCQPGMFPNNAPYPPNRPIQPGMLPSGSPYPGPVPFGGTIQGGPPPPPSMRFPGAPPF